MSQDTTQPIITSIFDEDLYKISMQKAVTNLYPRTKAKYSFINRGKTDFPPDFANALRQQVEFVGELSATPEELNFVTEKCPYFDPIFIDFLAHFRYNPKEVSISQSDNQLSIDVEGPWYKTIRWEVKLMALVSELYFKLAGNSITMIDRHILDNYGIIENARLKAEEMDKANAIYVDFGTRRRYSYRVHDTVVETLKKYGKNFVGTSNVHFAMKHKTNPMGTQAHEWIQFHAAKYGYRSANTLAMGRWVDVYHGVLGTVLTDTFTTNDFFKHFDSFYARLYDGVRHDSGDPIGFGEQTIKHYEKLKIDPLTKTIIFSDGLTYKEVIRLANYFNGRIKTSFGIGTHLTNSVGAKPLNIVIKMIAADPNGTGNWIPAIKLSDVEGKHTGNKDEIEKAIKEIGI